MTHKEWYSFDQIADADISSTDKLLILDSENTESRTITIDQLFNSIAHVYEEDPNYIILCGKYLLPLVEAVVSAGYGDTTAIAYGDGTEVAYGS